MEEIYLITGATGFLGREVAKQLTAQQKKVTGVYLEVCLIAQCIRPAAHMVIPRLRR